SWQKPRWITSFVKSDSLLRFKATRAEKFELTQPEQDELQHQTHGTAVKSVSVWILQMSPYTAEATTIRQK
ncbi:hypothetical protein, partial [Corynebacterium sp. HMSC076G08]|uniref:hypothetical protein n=1 Tax=Corynebacterium sp. HMSC076G08 TaxID=1739310 RepID=UPI001E2DA5DC